MRVTPNLSVKVSGRFLINEAHNGNKRTVVARLSTAAARLGNVGHLYKDDHNSNQLLRRRAAAAGDLRV